MEIKTDSRTQEGKIIGLIDSLISISRVLLPLLREKNLNDDRHRPIFLKEEIFEALKDLHKDEDLIEIMRLGPFNKLIVNPEDIEARQLIREAAELIKNNKNS